MLVQCRIGSLFTHFSCVKFSGYGLSLLAFFGFPRNRRGIGRSNLLVVIGHCAAREALQ